MKSQGGKQGRAGPNLDELDAFLDDDARWDDIASWGKHSQVDDARERPQRVTAPTPRLGRPRRQWDAEAALDLWLEPTPGYKRDNYGRWRYELTGLAVPGARDITLATLYNFAEDAELLLVPSVLAKAVDELAWCLKVTVGERTVFMHNQATSVLEVPLPEWRVRCHAPLGLDAPELAPTRLVDLTGVARLAGVSYNTALNYFYRRRQVSLRHRFPEPVARVAGRPVWSFPVIRSWLAARPGQGARGTKREAGDHRQARPSGRGGEPAGR